MSSDMKYEVPVENKPALFYRAFLKGEMSDLKKCPDAAVEDLLRKKLREGNADLNIPVVYYEITIKTYQEESLFNYLDPEMLYKFLQALCEKAIEKDNTGYHCEPFPDCDPEDFGVSELIGVLKKPFMEWEVRNIAGSGFLNPIRSEQFRVVVIGYKKLDHYFGGRWIYYNDLNDLGSI